MSDVEISYFCATCDAELQPGDAGQPCPNCGETKREVIIDVVENIRLIDQVKTELEEKGYKGWSKRMVSGEEHFKRDNEIRTVLRILDHKNRHEDGSYYEHITKTDTGEVVRSVREKLSEHQGRGSAKHAVPTFPHEWIAVAAYYIWEKAGCPTGRHINNWNQGKNHLKKMFKDGSLDVSSLQR